MNNYLRTVHFYTDGAYSSKSEMGGWASVCVEDDAVLDIQKGFEPYSTNNRMELTAFLSALEMSDQIETNRSHVIIHTDSAYIANCFKDKWYQKWMSNGWRTSDKQSVKNQDLWSRIIALYIKNVKRLNLEIIKVEAHTGDKYNEYANLLAIQQRTILEEVK